MALHEAKGEILFQKRTSPFESPKRKAGGVSTLPPAPPNDQKGGAQPLLFSEQEFEDAAQAAFVARRHRACFQVAELPVAVVRRLQDAFEPAAPRQASEGREVEDYQAGDRGGEYYSCQDSHCASYFRAGHIVSHWLYGAKIPFPAELRLYGLRFGLP